MMTTLHKTCWMTIALIVSAAALVWGTTALANKTMNTVSKSVMAEKGLSPSVKKFVVDKLMPIALNTVLVRETQAQNKQGVSLKQIQDIDEKWKAAEDEMPIQAEKLGNTCAAELKKAIAPHTQILEVFVMDNQGAVVCENTLTSDYWQGDEAKWKNSFNQGKGGVDVGKVKFDKSANAKLQQISVPLVTKSGQVVGAITFGLDITRL